MKIAAAQISCVPGDLAANLEKIRDFCTRAKEGGAELIVFPEMVDTGYTMPVIREQAKVWSEGAVPVLREIARTLALTIVCGVSERDRACIYNTQIAVDASGEIATKYRKTHLFSPKPVEEDKCFTAGYALATHQLGSFRLGLSICYDLRFPEVYRTLAIDEDADVFVISSAWPFPRAEHLRVLAMARAIENQSYLVLANRVGRDAGVGFCGGSAIIDPSGTVMAAASIDREDLILADLSRMVLDSVRERMPVLTHRRAELYGPRGNRAPRA